MTNNVRPIRDALDNAARPRRRSNVLPEDCPVVPLGVEGGTFWYLDALGQLTPLPRGKHVRTELMGIFTPQLAYLEQHWPRMKVKNNVLERTGEWRPEKCAEALMQACGSEGVWSPYAKVRGRGAWRGQDGDLILHLGQSLYINGRMERPGVRNGLVYPVRADRPRPAVTAQSGGDDGPAAELLSLLRTWHWRRERLDPVLMLGWIGAAMIGGALDWRPGAWLTGDRGTGKSTLQEVLKHLFEDGAGIYSVADTTAAGIRQRVEHDSLPVALDELEPEVDGSRVDQVLALLRLASSGGTILRGGADHTGADFIARFCFLASSILVPPMKPQDRSRIALLQLLPLAASRPPVLRPQALAMLGARLLRRMADMWRHLPERLETWREQLISAGYDARGADQFGTLLACADLLQHDHPPDGDTLHEMVGLLTQDRAGERSEESPDWARCLVHLMTTVASAWRGGEQRTIGTLVAVAAGRKPADDDMAEVPSLLDREAAARTLAGCGLRLEPLPAGVDGRPVPGLAVANLHTELARLFAHTHWQAKAGAGAAWPQALLRVPGARASGSSLRFAGHKQRAVIVPLAAALGDDAA